MTSNLIDSLKMHITYTSAGLNDANADDILACAKEIKEMLLLLSGLSSPIMNAALSSGSDKSRRIKGKSSSRSPIAFANEPDVDFKYWCDLGAIICALKGINNIFHLKPRLILGPAYRGGKSVMDVITHAKKHPNAYRDPTQGTGAYYKYGR